MNIPSALCKYKRYGEEVLDMLRSSSLYLSSLDRMNDKDEAKLKFAFDGQVEEVSQYIKSMGDEPDGETVKLVMEHIASHREEINNRIVSYFYNNQGICSLTSRIDDAWMWREYADGGRGVCIVYNTNVIIAFNRYIKQKAGFLIALDGVEYVDDGASINFYTSTPEQRVNHKIYTKTKKWSEEHEYRMVGYGIVNAKLEYPDEVIREVILGSKLTDTERKEIKSIFAVGNRQDVCVQSKC